MQDVIGALVNILAADETVGGLVSTRIYGSSLPPSETPNQARKAIVLRFAGNGGGAGSNDYVEVANQRIDVWNYGETAFEADKVRRASHDVMKRIQRQKQGTVLVHRANWSAGPIQMVDPEVGWPMVVETWLVLSAEPAAS